MKNVLIYYLVTGESFKLTVTEDPKKYMTDIAVQLAKKGISNLSDVIISDTPLESWGKGEKTRKVEQKTEEDLPVPPVPKPSSPNNLPNSTSDIRIVSTHEVEALNISVGTGGWLPTSLANQPKFPASVSLRYATYWTQVGSAIVTGEQEYTKQIAYTHGMSTTDSETLSGELGVSYLAVSAKVTESVGHSVTISSETTVSDTYKISVPKGTTTVYILWQLMESFVFVDAEGEPVCWNGYAFFNKASFPNEPKINQRNIVYSDRTDFID